MTQIDAEKEFVHWHEQNGCFRKRIGYRPNKSKDKIVESDFYFTEAGRDKAKATALAVAKREEWRILKRNWGTIGPKLAPLYPSLDMSKPFWPDLESPDKVNAQTDEVAKGERLQPHSRTIEQARDLYIAWYEGKAGRMGSRGRKQSSINTFRANLNLALKPLSLSAPIDTLTYPTIEAAIDFWYSQDVSERTALNYCRALKSFIDWMDNQPGLSFDKPKGTDSLFQLGKPKTSKYIPTDAEITTLLAAAKGARAELWAMLALNAGMYQTDISGMLPGELKGEYAVWQRDKQSHSNEDLTIHTWLFPETRTLIETYRAPKNSHGLLFVSKDGTPLEISHDGYRTKNISDDFGKLLKNAGFKTDADAEDAEANRLTFKTLRKWTANKLSQQSGRDNIVRSFLGQKIPGVMGESYVREFYAPLAAELQKLREWMVAQKILV